MHQPGCYRNCSGLAPVTLRSRHPTDRSCRWERPSPGMRQGLRACQSLPATLPAACHKLGFITLHALKVEDGGYRGPSTPELQWEAKLGDIRSSQQFGRRSRKRADSPHGIECSLIKGM